MQETFLTLSHEHIHIHPNAPQKKKSQQHKPPLPGSRRVTPTVSPSSSGDISTGKHVWPDGCVYEGEWKEGKPCGKGTFRWPSGATYEGEFRSGRVDGYGLFTGVDGDSYRGWWVADRKDGFGEKRYANGDLYEGWWSCNLQEGEGRYVWKNGNEYVGGWKKGAIWGKGVLVWANGNRYEGFWENGVPKGKGVFTLCDGTTCAGNWGMEMELMMMMALARKRSSVDGCRNVSFPRICIWELDGEAGDITCDIVDNVEASMFYKDGSECDSQNGGEGCEVVLHKSPFWCVDDAEVKKPGQFVSEGHKNYDLMLNFQLGIR